MNASPTQYRRKCRKMFSVVPVPVQNSLLANSRLTLVSHCRSLGQSADPSGSLQPSLHHMHMQYTPITTFS